MSAPLPQRKLVSRIALESLRNRLMLFVGEYLDPNGEANEAAEDVVFAAMSLFPDVERAWDEQSTPEEQP